MQMMEMKHEWARQYESFIQLLRQLQVDYRLARQQLQDVSSHFGDREAAATKQLRTALDAMAHIGPTSDDRYGGSAQQAPPRRSQPGESPAAGFETQQTRPTLEVYCLGRFQVRVSWSKVQRWHSLKAKSLLKYLVGQEGRPVSKDTLMEALWPGCEPVLAGNNLKAAVRALRQTLGSAQDANGDFVWVLFQDGNYLINSNVDLWTDVEQFEYHWHAGRQLEKAGKVAEAVKEHEIAEALYRGDYLEDDLYEEWTSLRREALKDIYLAILGRLADYSMQNGDCEGCIVHCQRILLKDPCREDAYRRLMRCYSRLGHRNRAIAWYRLCEKTIKAELDVSPDQLTVALYEKLLNDDYI